MMDTLRVLLDGRHVNHLIFFAGALLDQLR